MKATIVLHRDNIYYDIDALTYKFSETSIQDSNIGDKVASDTGDRFDETIISRMCELRYSKLLQSLEFCLDKHFEDTIVLDDQPQDTGCFEFNLVFDIPLSKDVLIVAKNHMHDYMVKGVLLDWYTKIGTGVTQDLILEVDKLERTIVSVFRTPGFVPHIPAPLMPSYKIR